MRLRRLAFLAVIATFAPAVSLAAPPSSRTKPWVSVQAATQPAPTLATDGFDLRSVTGFRVAAEAASGTIAAACWLRAYVWSEALGKWARSAAADTSGNGLTDWEILAVNVGRTTPLVFPDQKPVVPSGRVYYATDGCTGGMTVVVEGVTQ